ncbi:MAG: adenosylcobinamide-phosphate synthase CbiB [Thermoleophilia bacterium]
MTGLLAISANWPVATATVLLAGLFDVLIGEPPNALHPVVWMGSLAGFMARRRPLRGRRAELAWGVVIVVTTAGLAGAAGVALTFGLAHLPVWLAVPVAAWILKTTFSLRGLVGAGRHVQRALATDTAVARDGLKALVSRDRQLEPAQIVSAAVESLAENLTDSVVAPLLFFALLGLPGALVYRAINTMDAMIGYHGEYEYVGKVAARTDDVVNWLPARLTGLLVVAVAVLRRGGRAAWPALRTQRRPSPGPNKLWTICPMAGALGVQLEKRGVYAVGPDSRPLAADVIGEAITVVWVAGTITIAATAALAALVVMGVYK